MPWKACIGLTNGSVPSSNKQFLLNKMTTSSPDPKKLNEFRWFGEGRMIPRSYINRGKYTHVFICFVLLCYLCQFTNIRQDLYSLSGRTSYRKISRSRKIRIYTFSVALQFDRHLGSSAAEMPVKLQSDTVIIAINLAAPRLNEIWR